MAMVINTNIASLNAQRNLGRTQGMLSQSLERLSSGLRINSAKDDAAGLAISNRMTAQIRGLNQAVRNANDGISLAQTAEGALQEISSSLQRIRELGVQSANDSNSVSDRSSLQAEVVQLQAEITRISEQTEFNSSRILDGSFLNAKFQIGIRADQTINVSIGNTKANNIGAYQVVGPDAAADATGGGVTRVAADDFTVSGYKGSAEVSVVDNASAETIATSVNNVTADTGVTATGKTEIALSAFDITTGGSSFNFDLTGDDTATIVGTISATTGTALDAFVQAVNDHAATTGVTANRDGDTVVLTSATGDNIRLENNLADAAGFQVTVGAAASFGALDADDFCVAGAVTLESEKTFGVLEATAGEVFTNPTETAELSKVSDIDISSQSGSGNALSVIDKAIAYIDSVRGTLGAIQNRFESTIANLQGVSENVSAARSRIMDADFAAETANMTKAQILQQAGVAMLAQANMLPQTVLSLLQ